MRITRSGLVTRWYGRLFFHAYRFLPARRHLLRVVVAREGGQMTSASLRRVLRTHHGVEVGAHSYGSLLEPGASDVKTSIGAYVSIGPNVRRFGAAHPSGNLSMHPYWYNPALGYASEEDDVERSACVIEGEVWIGANSIILPGCTRVGFGSVIGAGSVVTRSVAPFDIVAGSPARKIGSRLTQEQQERLQEIWAADLSPRELRTALDSIEKAT